MPVFYDDWCIAQALAGRAWLMAFILSLNILYASFLANRKFT